MLYYFLILLSRVLEVFQTRRHVNKLHDDDDEALFRYKAHIINLSSLITSTLDVDVVHEICSLWLFKFLMVQSPP